MSEHEESSDAERWLDAAAGAFDDKQARLQAGWLRDVTQWQFDRTRGELSVTRADGSVARARAQILGAYAVEQQTWEWGWSSSHLPLEHAAARVREIGERFGLAYLTEGEVAIDRDAEALISYFCAIGVEATGAAGVFQGGDARQPIVFLVFNPD